LLDDLDWKSFTAKNRQVYEGREEQAFCVRGTKGKSQKNKVEKEGLQEV